MEKSMKILSIGNSFSNDAHRYLHSLAKLEGEDIKTVNLYISGCSLQRHYDNMINDSYSYDFELNGQRTGTKISIKQALESEDWDVVTLQQASRFSWQYKSYSPYIEELSKYIKKLCPNAKIFIHQTWAYEDGSNKLKEMVKLKSSKQMLKKIAKCYRKIAKKIKADGIILCGEAMSNALKFGMEKVHRDCFHASYGAGRYLLALCWYKALTGNDISNNNFNDFDEPFSQKEREIVIKAVNSVF